LKAMPENHIMLDLETLDSGPTAAIVSIGAVRMDFENLALLDDFYRMVDARSCEEYGLKIGADTVLWWLAQSEQAWLALTYPNRLSLPEALGGFSNWAGVSPVIWGNGATFDNVILRNAYRAARARGALVAYPASYRDDLCYRTMRRMFPLKAGAPDGNVGVRHNALDDARAQAVTLLAILKGLRNGG
jgi:hypothetical protein